MTAIRIVDVTDEAGFGRIPPCADPGFDHRTCDYWEDEKRGSKAAASPGWSPTPATAPEPVKAIQPVRARPRGPTFNPFDPRAGRPRPAGNPFDPFGDDDEDAIDNPFAPRPKAAPTVAADAPRKLQLLARGLAVFGSYAKVLEVDGEPPRTASSGRSRRTRARRVRDLYPSGSELAAAGGHHLHRHDGGGPRPGPRAGARRGGRRGPRGRGSRRSRRIPSPRPTRRHERGQPGVLAGCGFDLAIDDPRFPVVRREL